jgi:hypothetical protein
MPFAIGAVAIDNGTVLVLITLLVTPIAAIAFARSGPAWKSIGKGPLEIEREPPQAPHQPPTPSRIDRVAQEREVRQMLEAKSERLRRRGESPLNVELEARRLLAPGTGPSAPASQDAELREEVRQLVVARNERRLRRGLAPLDVEAETGRQLEDFVGSRQ